MLQLQVVLLPFLDSYSGEKDYNKKLCLQVCPEVFELNEQNIAVVKVTPIPPEVEETCREAASGCPVEAIKIIE